MAGNSATEQLAQLVAARVKAGRRTDALEAAQRDAGQARDAARAALIDLERRGGGKAAERSQLEQALAEAQAAVSAPWPERVAGVRAAVRDAQAEVQRFVAAHLSELVAEREAAGEAIARQLNAAAQEIVTGYAEWQAIAAEVGQLAALAGGAPRPGDVSRSKASTDALARAATELIREGGEQGPRLVRDSRVPRLGAPAAEQAVPA